MRPGTHQIELRAPGFVTETRIYPDDDVAVVILMNATQTGALSRFAHEICERLC